MDIYLGTTAITSRQVTMICANPLYPARGHRLGLIPARTLLDSGAFSDGHMGRCRLTPAAAAERQLYWEAAARKVWGRDYRADIIVAYDALARTANDRATIKLVQAETWANNQWLDLHRGLFGERVFVFPLQGNDERSFSSAAARNIPLIRAGDWCGLGGWCTLGRRKTRLPIFLDVLHRVASVMVNYRVSHLHLFGISWIKALVLASRIAKNYGVTLSTDSAAPMRLQQWGRERCYGRTLEQTLAWYHNKLRWL